MAPKHQCFGLDVASQALLLQGRSFCSLQAGAHRLHHRMLRVKGRTGNHTGAALKLAVGSSCGAASAGSFSMCCDARLLYMLTARGAKSTCARGTSRITDQCTGNTCHAAAHQEARHIHQTLQSTRPCNQSVKHNLTTLMRRPLVSMNFMSECRTGSCWQGGKAHPGQRCRANC